MNYFPRFPDGKDRAVTLSYDDGVKQDQRIIALLKSHGMKGTFNINGNLFHPETPLSAQSSLLNAWPDTVISGMLPMARFVAM